MIKATNGTVTGELKKAETAITRKNPDNVKVRVKRDTFYVVDQNDFYYPVGFEFPSGEWSEVQAPAPTPVAATETSDEDSKTKKSSKSSNKKSDG